MKDFSVNSFQISQGDDVGFGSNYHVNDAVSEDDILSFESEMSKVQSSDNATFSDKIIDKFSSISEDIGIKKEMFENKLMKASSTGDPSDILEASRAMADYQLQVQVTTKVASKTNSSIEKLSNLQ